MSATIIQRFFLRLQTNVILTDPKSYTLHSSFLYPLLLNSSRKTPYLQPLGPQLQKTFLSITKRKTSHLSMQGSYPCSLSFPWDPEAPLPVLIFKICNTHSRLVGNGSLFERPKGKKPSMHSRIQEERDRAQKLQGRFLH